jgi:trigger factor
LIKEKIEIMDVQVKELSSIKQEISITVPAEDVAKEYQKTLSRFASKAKIKGFRPGKVPFDIVQKMYAAEIRESVVDSLVPGVLNQALKDRNLNPVGMPILTDLQYSEGEPLQFKAEMESWPAYDLPEYTKIRLNKKDTKVSDEDLDAALEDIRAQSAQYVPTEARGVQDGDYVVAEIKGRDTETKRFLPTEKSVILANHPENEPLLNEKLIGLKKDEETQFTISYEKDHKNKKVAGKTVDYNLKVLSIKEKTLPDINEEFAKDLGDYKDLDDLKNKLRERIQLSKDHEARGQLAEELIKKIANKIEIELPGTILEQETNSVLQRMFSDAKSGRPITEDMEMLKKEAREKAESNIINHLVLTKIAEKEKLEVTEEDYQEELNRLAEVNRVTLAQVKQSLLQENRAEELRENLLIRKTIDFLLDSAIIK